MLFNVVGIQRVDMRSGGEEVHGTKLYGIIKDNQVKGYIGEPTTAVWFADDNAKAKIPDGTTIGSLIEIYFEQNKKTPAFCREYDGE